MRCFDRPTCWLMILALLLAAAPATALATECKDLDKAACTRAPGCVWVDPYMRRNEVKVKGFCHATERGDESDDD